MVATYDLVISLIPYIHHAKVIKAAIKGKTHVVTTSYVSPAMRELDGQAKEAGIVVMNEIGLDPGIDHLYAVKIIDDVHSKGGKVGIHVLWSSSPLTGRHRSSPSSLTAAVFQRPKRPTTRSDINSLGPLVGSFSPCSTVPHSFKTLRSPKSPVPS